MKHRHKVIIPGGKTVDLLRTNVAETFERVRKEQAAALAKERRRARAVEKEQADKVRPLVKQAASK